MTEPTLGSGTNEFVSFGTGVGANVETPSDWAADTVRQQGFQRGLANSTQANTVLRQASFIAAMIGQFSADYSSEAMLDGGDVLEAEQIFIDALRRVFRGVFFMNDTGTANAMVASDSVAPTPTAYDGRMLIVVKKMNQNNTGAMTANLWNLGQVALQDNTGAPLTNGALIANSYYILTWNGTAFRVLGGVAQYTNVTELTAQSGDMISVASGSGIVDFRTLRGTHDATPNDGDRWPRGEQSDDTAKYMTSLELLAWIEDNLPQSGAILGIQCITDTGTYTKTNGTMKALVFATGGGGAGGMHVCCAGAGGAGSTAIALCDLSGTNTVACTIGAGGVGVQAGSGGSTVGGNGGQTSFGSYAVAGGGQGGQGGDKGGNGGTATTGTMLIRGGDGGTSFAGGYWGAGNGGASYWGGGGCGADYYGARTGSGYAGTAFGSGGGGGDSGMGTGRTGGNGAKGVIFVIEFS